MKETNPAYRFASWVVILAGAALRFFHLGGRFFWVDEVESFDRASLPLGETVAALLRSTPHMPAYEILLNFWISISQTDEFARLLSVIFGIISLFVAFRIFRTAAGAATALTALLFFALSPLHIMFSRIVREYSFFCLAGLASTLLLIRLRYPSGGDTGRARLPYFLSALVLVYAHYYGWLIIISHTAWFAWSRPGKAALKKWFALQAGVFFLFLPWFLLNVGYLLSGTDYLKTYYGSIFGPHVKILYLFFALSLGLTVYPWNWAVVLPAAAGFAAAFIPGATGALRAAVSAYKRVPSPDRALAALPGMMFFIPMAFAVFIPPFAPRHMLPSLPFFCLIAAAGVQKLPYKCAKTALCLLICLGSLSSSANYFANTQYFDRDMITPWDRITAAIEERAGPGDAIVLAATYSANFYRYYDGPARTIYTFQKEPWFGMRHSKIHGERLDIRTLSGFGQLEEAVSSAERTWFLVSDGWVGREKLISYLENRGAENAGNYLYGESTVRGLREGWRERGRYSTYLYRLYLLQTREH